jgi:glycosyltransferase involved in cell wall biosynthesis
MYNVAPYVERCLRSLANQDIPYNDYEIICVNDGSPDNCAEIVKRRQNEIPNIILINQENQGVSMARNNAIAIAKGKYILPIDPDDYVVSNCLKNALEKAEKEQLDVLYCAFEILDENFNHIWRTNYADLEQKIYSGYDGYFAVRGEKVQAPDRSWGILYRNAVIKEKTIYYPKDVPILEDAVFLGKIFIFSERVGYLNKSFYVLNLRNESAMSSGLINKKPARVGFQNAIEDLNTFKSENGITKKCLSLIGHIQLQFALKYIISCRNLGLYKEAIPFIKINKEIFANEDVLQREGFLEKMYLRFIVFSPFLFFLLQPFLIRLIFHVRNYRPNK